jgi:pantothenate kinase
MPVTERLVAQLVERATAAGARRYVVGIAGAPGAGKSTITARLVEAVERADPSLTVSLAPMDGFHLSNRQLDRLGLRHRKGAPETFDAAGYAALLRRIRDDVGQVVYAPDFDRGLDEAIAAGHAIAAGPGLVVAEGNYLLLPTGSWPDVRAAIDETWFLDVPEHERADRCRRRQEFFGRSPEAAAAWARDVDLPNGVLVTSSRDRADVVLRPGDAPELGY